MGAGHLKLTGNCLALLAVAQAMSKQLMETQTTSGLFATATISDNTFSEASNLFIAGRMLTVHHSTLLAEVPRDRPPPMGFLLPSAPPPLATWRCRGKTRRHCCSARRASIRRPTS
ncbi:hypothetical protein [Pigmentiphaga litoralis]|uniref:hypothetical protein n=1 Tax=Pigmentiphaga litoralis TaxID=516702 RepID=UPI003B43B457